MQNKIYVGLDCLLDFRFSVYLQLNRTAAIKSIENGTYHNRNNDRLPGVNYDTFKKMCDKYDEQTLKMATLTNIAPMLRNTLKELVTVLANDNFNGKPVIDVNIYPFSFTEDVGQEFIRTMYMSILKDAVDFVDINLISIPFKSLHLSECVKHYKVMYVYDYQNWFLSRKEEISNKEAFHDMTIISPLLYDSEDYNEADLKEMLENGEDPCQLMEKTLEMLGINISLVRPHYFSVLGGYAV